MLGYDCLKSAISLPSKHNKLTSPPSSPSPAPPPPLPLPSLLLSPTPPPPLPSPHPPLPPPLPPLPSPSPSPTLFPSPSPPPPPPLPSSPPLLLPLPLPCSSYLRSGDQLLSVNGVSLASVRHMQAVHILRDAGKQVSLVSRVAPHAVSSGNMEDTTLGPALMAMV